MPPAGSRHADPFGRVAKLLSTSLARWYADGGGGGGRLPQDRAMLDRYGADLQIQRAIEAKRRRGEMY
jgi:hypothetical protein